MDALMIGKTNTADHGMAFYKAMQRGLYRVSSKAVPC